MPTIEQLEKLLHADPDDDFVLYALAQAHASRGDHDRAIEYYTRCIGVAPNHAYAHYHLARSQDELGDRDAAQHTLRAGLDAAQRAGDDKAIGEIRALLDELEP